MSPGNQLGWEWNHTPPIPNENNTYTLPETLPLLSHAELLLIYSVLEQMEKLPGESLAPRQLHSFFSEYCAQHQLLIEREQAEYLMRVLELHTQPSGILRIFLDDPKIEEIAIAGIGETFPLRVFIAKEGWKNTSIYFSSAAALITLINRISLHTGKRLSHATPTLNARLSDGSRLHASMQPVCVQDVELTIRKFIFRAQTPQALLESNIISPRAISFLKLAMQTDCNILIVGNTGSGKTTTLNALLGSLPQEERFVLVEETPELQLAQPHQVRFTPSSGAKLEMSELIRETLRMRPDRVVIGEIRFPEEAKACMESILAGQGKGTYATFHGHSAAEACARLRQFGILEQDLGWINIMVTQKRWTQHLPNGASSEVRAISEITEVSADATGKLRLRPIFAWDEKTNRLKAQKKSQLVKEKFNWNFPQEIFEEKWDTLTREYTIVTAPEKEKVIIAPIQREKPHA